MGVFGHELGAEDAVLVAVNPKAIAVHWRDELSGKLVIEVDFEVFSGHHEL